MLRIESARPERSDSVLVDHLVKILIVPDLDLLNLVGSTEAVEEVDERNAALYGGEMSDRAEIHDLLRVGLSEHSEAGLTAGVNVGVVTEDVESV